MTPKAHDKSQSALRALADYAARRYLRESDAYGHFLKNPGLSEATRQEFRETRRKARVHDRKTARIYRKAVLRRDWGIVKTLVVWSHAAMSQTLPRPPLYKGFRFPPEIISQGVWLYYRFGVSLRDVSELLLARGIEVSYEAIRLWTVRFGLEYARRLRRTRGTCSNIWHLDELCLMEPARTSGISMNSV
jgi:hypothetical protein